MLAKEGCHFHRTTVSKRGADVCLGRETGTKTPGKFDKNIRMSNIHVRTISRQEKHYGILRDGRRHTHKAAKRRPYLNNQNIIQASRVRPSSASATTAHLVGHIWRGCEICKHGTHNAKKKITVIRAEIIV